MTMTSKQFRDTRTGDTVTTFNIMDIAYMEEVNEKNQEETTICPVCFGDMDSEQVRNALSRRDNETYICSDCGTREALADFMEQTKNNKTPDHE